MKVRLGWLCAALVVGLVLAGCGSNNSSSATISISPSSATVLLGTSLQFIPNVTGSSNAVVWSVNGIQNGNATVGMISSTGLYTAPVTRPVAVSPIAVPVVFALANASLPNSGFSGSVIELKSGSDFTNFAPGNTINISGNSQAAWNSSFIIQAATILSDGNFGVQIATPAGPPANGVGGSATATPNITITAQVESTSAVASAVVTLDSGVRISVTQPSCTIGTSEQFSFTAAVSGTSNQAATWTLTGVGTIDPNSGLYTAPATAGTATITATSVADPTESASATVTIVTAADPTLSSVSPPTGAIGAMMQNVYLSGSNFICTTAVFVNGNPLPAGSLFSLSSTSLLVVVPDSILSTQPAVPLTFTVQRQGGTAQACTPSPCVLTLSPVRPAIVAATPDSFQQPSSGTFSVTLDGGYFGTTNSLPGFPGNPTVNAQFNGQTNGTLSFNSDRQLVLAVPASDVSAPGLYPITLTNKAAGSTNGSLAGVNLAVEPVTTPTQIGPAFPVGTTPSSVAINTATGVALVANQASNDVTTVNLGSVTSPSLSSGTASLCTGAVGTSSKPCAIATGPTSVAVDNIRNLALVANNATASLAVIDLSGARCVPTSAPCVTSLLTFPSADVNGNQIPLAPQAVGINPVSGRALVAFTTSSGAGGSNAGAILDMSQLQAAQGAIALPAPSPSPILINVVNINNGPQPHIAVSSRLNWALATPGGAGSLSIVDLGRQTVNSITNISCTSGTPSVVTVTVNATVGLQAGQPVLISGAAPSGLNGIFPVRTASSNTFTYSLASCAAGTGGTAAYALPVATLATNPNVRGVSLNDETQKALIVDPTNTVPAFVFNILDQSSPAVGSLLSGANNVATAMNPLTNMGLIVNKPSVGAGTALIVDPTIPAVIGSPFNTGNSPVDVAIDPAANTALIVNQADNTVSLFSLGAALRSAPQIAQSSFLPAGSTQTSSHVTINSSLGSPASPVNQTVTLVGKFTGTSAPRLDGDATAFTGVTVSNGGRLMTATLLGTVLAPNGPRLYLLDAADSTGASNAVSLQAIQAVSLITSDCSNPAPQGVAIDIAHNAAVVTEPGCNDVSMVSLANSTGFTIGTGFGANPELAVGTTPQGIAVYPHAGLAVAANAGSNNVSIVDIVNDGVPTTFTADPLPSGVAIDPGTGKGVVAAGGASVVDVFPVSTTAPTPSTIGVQQGPSGVAIDPKSHHALVANSTSNTATLLDLSANAAIRSTNPITFPEGVAFDPVSGNFLITSGASNQVVILDPNTFSTTPIRVGIDPSSIAYNFASGTLVTANSLSGTMTIVDFIDHSVRGLFSLPSSSQFAVDIHPQTNLAVVADPMDNQLLLVPLPH
jgi:DNA-binding beta-propeller fold protein YncE